MYHQRSWHNIEPEVMMTLSSDAILNSANYIRGDLNSIVSDQSQLDKTLQIIQERVARIPDHPDASTFEILTVIGLDKLITRCLHCEGPIGFLMDVGRVINKCDEELDSLNVESYVFQYECP